MLTLPEELGRLNALKILDVSQVQIIKQSCKQLEIDLHTYKLHCHDNNNDPEEFL